MKNNKRTITWAAVIIVFIFLVYLLTGTNLIDFGNQETENVVLGDKIITVPKGVTIEEIPIEENVNAPSLDRPIIIPDTYTPAAEQLMRVKISNAIDSVTSDPSSSKNWINLGNLRRTIHDYEGAKEVYEYIAKATPENYVPFINLGILYHLDLKDFVKAEENFQRALENAPVNDSIYRSFHELYRYSYKQDTSLAVDILKRGIEKIPNSVDLRTLLASYYKEQGNMASAIQYYTEARDLARTLGNSNLVKILEEEIERLQ